MEGWEQQIKQYPYWPFTFPEWEVDKCLGYGWIHEPEFTHRAPTTYEKGVELVEFCKSRWAKQNYKWTLMDTSTMKPALAPGEALKAQVKARAQVKKRVEALMKELS